MEIYSLTGLSRWAFFMQSIRVTLLAIAIFAAWGVQKAGAAQGTYYTKGGGYMGNLQERFLCPTFFCF